MPELNREDIIKALEWCSSGGACSKCAENEANFYLTREGCMSVQMQNALTLIKLLTEENERLKEKADRHLDNLKAVLDERAEEKETVKCKDCEYLELELPYGVCSKAYKGIVRPDDTCSNGKRREK